MDEGKDRRASGSQQDKGLVQSICMRANASEILTLSIVYVTLYFMSNSNMSI